MAQTSLFNRSDLIHFMGIGGAGMAPLAAILYQLGFKVQGSDRTTNNNAVEKLESLGIRVIMGHQASNLKGVTKVVYSSAIKADFPELNLAQSDPGIKVFHRSEVLWDLVKSKKVIAVAGAHGKTSTSAMMVAVLDQAQSRIGETGFVIGGPINNPRDLISNGHWGDGEYAVIEADESDGSFVNYFPDYTLITSIEPDHLDHFGNYESFEQVFIDFLAQTQKQNFLCFEDKGVQKIIPKLVDAGINFQLYHISDSFLDDQNFDWFGEHNVLNAVGVSQVALTLGLTKSEILEGLHSYRLPNRRLQIVRNDPVLTVIDDYAHHPTEIKASLEAIIQKFPGRRTLVIFQPHLYSRTKFFQKEFAQALSQADLIVVTGIYAARELAPGDVGPETIAQHNPKIKAIENLEAAADWLISQLQPQDVAIIMGAGDVYQVLPKFLDWNKSGLVNQSER